ncbi:MAG: DUF1835 domain-containing protein [Pseudomonadota bacterium]
MTRESVIHIRCGTDIQQTLVDAGFSDDFLAFYDPYVHGPVPRADSLDDFLQCRAHFIADSLHPNYDEVLEGLQQQYAALDGVRHYDAAYLWFEHDSFDQLILAKLLAYFADREARPAHLKMISITQYPGIDRFIGLGQLPPEALQVLWQEFMDVTPEQLELGVQVWAAVQSPSPDALFEVIAGGTPALPTMAIALDRHLKELPSKRNGLSLAEDLTLQILDDKGDLTAAKLFNWYNNQYEPLPFMGDSGYWLLLDGLASCGKPALTIARQGEQPNDWHVSLTDVGRQLLAGDADWVELNGIDRWLGGIHLNSRHGGLYRSI